MTTWCDFIPIIGGDKLDKKKYQIINMKNFSLNQQRLSYFSVDFNKRMM